MIPEEKWAFGVGGSNPLTSWIPKGPLFSAFVPLFFGSKAEKSGPLGVQVAASIGNET